MIKDSVRNCLGLLVLFCVALASIPVIAIGAANATNVSINVTGSVVRGDRFTVGVAVSGLVDFNSYQLQIVYDPNLIQVDDIVEGGTQGVTAGLIGATPVPVDMWTFYPRGTPGTIRIVGRVPGNVAVTGMGTLAEIHFRSIGSSGSSGIALLDPPGSTYTNKLFNYMGDVISPVSWSGSAVNVTPPALFINTNSLAYGVTGTSYSLSLSATGGLAPYSWSIQSGKLPDGLTLNSVGLISGTPSTAGSQDNITFSVADALKSVSTKNFSMTVLSPLSVSTNSLSYGLTGSSYSQSLTAAGGLAPLSWSIQSGTLPAGLTLSATGTISGTPTTAGGPIIISFMVTDSLGANSLKDLSITILAPLSINTSSLPYGVTGTSYSLSLSVTGGLAPFSWSIQSGKLPDGLSLNSVGLISGTPNTAGSQDNITFSVTDALKSVSTKNFSMTVLSPLSVSTNSLGYGLTGSSYVQSLTAAGGLAPFSWSIQSGTLPAGLTLSATGTISGTPTTAGGPVIISFTVTDALGANSPKDLSITILAPLSINTSSLPCGVIGSSYSLSLAVTGGLAPYSWSIQSGKLPDGLSLNVIGSISGIPLAAGGPFKITVSVTDALGTNITKILSIVILDEPIMVSVVSPTNVAPGSDFVATVIVNHIVNFDSYQLDFSYNPDVIQVTGVAPGLIGLTSVPIGGWEQVPSGVQGKTRILGNLSGVTGINGSGFLVQINFHVNGTPGQNSGITFSDPILFDTDGIPISPLITLSGSVSVVSPLQINTALLPEGTVGAVYFDNLTALGGRLPYLWSVTGLPAGLFTSAAGGIAGTPSVSGDFVVHISVTDSANPAFSTSVILNMHVNAPVNITVTSLPPGKIGILYSTNLSATGGKSPYLWSATGLPNGLSLSADGVISGTPTAPGDFAVSVTLSDSFLVVNTKTILLTLKIYLNGDTNGDGQINMGDVTSVERIILGVSVATPAADANNDGMINMGDVTKIERIILGID